MLFGIEHEVALIKDGVFVDHTNTSFSRLNSLLENLPQIKSDKLRIDRFKIMRKRWYVEGYERFDDEGKLSAYLPKGIEIRTSPQPSIEKAVGQLSLNFRQLSVMLHEHDFATTWISYHPYLTEFVPEKPYSKFERKHFGSSPEDRTAYLAQLSYGPDLNISLPNTSDEKLIDVGKKLTYYSPFLVPFSFSSPFFEGELWKGLSVRTFIRTGKRHAARVFLAKKANLIKDNALTSLYRQESEKGRVEFKSFDSCQNSELYGSLLALIKGLVLDKKLPGRSLHPDTKMHQFVAVRGFSDKFVKDQAESIVKAAKFALKNDKDRSRLLYLEQILDSGEIPGKQLVASYRKTRSIIQTLNQFPSLI
ncbi:MAG: hypothetical protein ACM3KM_03905 [Acidobacteriaceae bacterium]